MCILRKPKVQRSFQLLAQMQCALSFSISIIKYIEIQQIYINLFFKKRFIEIKCFQPNHPQSFILQKRAPPYKHHLSVTFNIKKFYLKTFNLFHISLSISIFNIFLSEYRQIKKPRDSCKGGGNPYLYLACVCPLSNSLSCTNLPTNPPCYLDPSLYLCQFQGTLE